jgi:hypothetical protein
LVGRPSRIPYSIHCISEVAKDTGIQFPRQK